MSFFDSIKDHVEGIAGKLGVSPEQFKSISDSLEAKIAQGGDKVEALQATAAEHGISVDKLKDSLSGLNAEGGLLDKIGLGGQDGLLAKGMSAFDKDGDGNALNDLTDSVKGLFGKK